MNKKTIPIFYTIDENYAPYFSVALASLIDHASDLNNYTVHVIYQMLSEETLKKLKTLETEHVKLQFTNINDKIKPIEEKLKKQIKKTHFPISIYFRIFLPFLFPEYDKGIYIDSDTVLNADVADLYNEDLKDNLIGAIYDTSIFDTPFTGYLENTVGLSNKEYINSGVLLMNMKRLRDIQFESHFLYLLNKYDFEVIAPDQDYINAMCKGNILYLDPRWNSMPVEGKKGAPDPKLIHYNLFLKPWHYDVEYDEYFWKYANASLFAEMIKQEKANYTSENKQKDQETLKAMIEHAHVLEKNETTFKSIFESGEETRI